MTKWSMQNSSTFGQRDSKKSKRKKRVRRIFDVPTSVGKELGRTKITTVHYVINQSTCQSMLDKAPHTCCPVVITSRAVSGNRPVARYPRARSLRPGLIGMPASTVLSLRQYIINSKPHPPPLPTKRLHPTREISPDPSVNSPA